MPFLVCDLAPGKAGDIVAQRPRGVSLAGSAGPLRKHAERHFREATDGVVKWTLDETGILQLLGEGGRRVAEAGRDGGWGGQEPVEL